MDSVRFENLKAKYYVNENITIEYILCGKIRQSSHNWVGLFPKGSSKLLEYIIFEWTIVCPRDELSSRQSITFLCKHFASKVKYGQDYQFLFVNRNMKVLGRSSYFHFLPVDNIDKQSSPVKDDIDSSNSEVNFSSFCELLDPFPPSTQSPHLQTELFNPDECELVCQSKQGKLNSVVNTCQSRGDGRNINSPRCLENNICTVCSEGSGIAKCNQDEQLADFQDSKIQTEIYELDNRITASDTSPRLDKGSQCNKQKQRCMSSPHSLNIQQTYEVKDLPETTCSSNEPNLKEPWQCKGQANTHPESCGFTWNTELPSTEKAVPNAAHTFPNPRTSQITCRCSPRKENYPMENCIRREGTYILSERPIPVYTYSPSKSNSTEIPHTYPSPSTPVKNLSKQFGNTFTVSSPDLPIYTSTPPSGKRTCSQCKQLLNSAHLQQDYIAQIKSSAETIRVMAHKVAALQRDLEKSLAAQQKLKVAALYAKCEKKASQKFLGELVSTLSRYDLARIITAQGNELLVQRVSTKPTSSDCKLHREQQLASNTDTPVQVTPEPHRKLSFQIAAESKEIHRQKMLMELTEAVRKRREMINKEVLATEQSSLKTGESEADIQTIESDGDFATVELIEEIPEKQQIKKTLLDVTSEITTVRRENETLDIRTDQDQIMESTGFDQSDQRSIEDLEQDSDIQTGALKWCDSRLLMGTKNQEQLCKRETPRKVMKDKQQQTELVVELPGKREERNEKPLAVELSEVTWAEALERCQEGMHNKHQQTELQVEFICSSQEEI